MKKLNERTPISARAAVPTLPVASGGMRLDDFGDDDGTRREHVDEALASTVGQRSVLPASPTAPSPPPSRTTKMIATPIDARLRKMIRDLRGEHEVSEAFTLETALRDYFGDRPLDEIAADLRRRGGRLRRTK